MMTCCVVRECDNCVREWTTPFRNFMTQSRGRQVDRIATSQYPVSNTREEASVSNRRDTTPSTITGCIRPLLLNCDNREVQTSSGLSSMVIAVQMSHSGGLPSAPMKVYSVQPTSIVPPTPSLSPANNGSVSVGAPLEVEVGNDSHSRKLSAMRSAHGGSVSSSSDTGWSMLTSSASVVQPVAQRIRNE